MQGPRPSDDKMNSLMMAARSIVAEKGLSALSLRTLGKASGWTLGDLTYHFGKKQYLLDAFADHEAKEQIEAIGGFTALAKLMTPLDKQTLAALTNLCIDDAVSNRRALSLSWFELLLDHEHSDATAAAIESVRKEQTAAWQELLEQGGHPHAGWLAPAIAAFVAEETLHSLSLGALPEYRLLRNANIARMLDGVFPASHALDFAPLIDRLHSQLRREPSDHSGRRGTISQAIGDLVATSGVGAISHRAVAMRADVPPSTVAHYFRTRADILHAGIEWLYAALQDGLQQDMPRGPRDSMGIRKILDPASGAVVRTLSRVGHQISLAAARDPALAPFAAMARSRRGRHARIVFPGAAATGNMDIGAAQVLSLVASGAHITSGTWDKTMICSVAETIENIIKYSLRSHE